MKVSELIKQLWDVKAAYGDIPVSIAITDIDTLGDPFRVHRSKVVCARYTRTTEGDEILISNTFM
jgi:hypothetical protein